MKMKHQNNTRWQPPIIPRIIEQNPNAEAESNQIKQNPNPSSWNSISNQLESVTTRPISIIHINKNTKNCRRSHKKKKRHAYEQSTLHRHTKIPRPINAYTDYSCINIYTQLYIEREMSTWGGERIRQDVNPSRSFEFFPFGFVFMSYFS